jgi:hypothetical protein
MATPALGVSNPGRHQFPRSHALRSSLHTSIEKHVIPAGIAGNQITGM